MSFKRSDLAALGIEPEKIQTLIDWHMETVKGLQAEIDRSKDTNDKLTNVQAELDKVKKDLETANKTIAAAEKDDYKGKYESATQELEKLKADTAAKETTTAKQTALKGKLKEAGYSDRAMSLIIRNGFADSVEIDENGQAKNLDDVIKSIQSDNDFSGFTPEIKETKHTPANPPANAGGTKPITKEEIMAIKNTAERQQKIAENPELFGIAKG